MERVGVEKFTELYFAALKRAQEPRYRLQRSRSS